VEKRPFLDYFGRVLGPSPIPVVSNWSEAARKINHWLRSPAELAALQSDCVAFWAAYKADLKIRVRAFIERNSMLPHGGRMYSPLITSRAYAYLELLRHHNVPAVLRRMKRQFERLVSQKRWRESS
jgi:hypothetical protein